MTNSWSFELPYARAPKGLHSNDRSVWQVKARSTREVRLLVSVLARVIPKMDRCHVQVEWFVPDLRKRDADGPEGLCKAIFDALGSDRGVSARIVPDDTPEHMVKPRLAIVYDKGCTPHFKVTVTDLSHPNRSDGLDQLVRERL